MLNCHYTFTIPKYIYMYHAPHYIYMYMYIVSDKKSDKII